MKAKSAKIYAWIFVLLFIVQQGFLFSLETVSTTDFVAEQMVSDDEQDSGATGCCELHQKSSSSGILEELLEEEDHRLHSAIEINFFYSRVKRGTIVSINKSQVHLLELFSPPKVIG